jgi:oleate hydratase
MSTPIDTTHKKAWLAGGGIASLAAAVFLIRDGRMPGDNITIFEQSDIAGGSLDGGGEAEKGYVIRGGRMLNFTYYCTYQLLSSIPSLTSPGLSVHEEIVAFNQRVKTHANARLVDKYGKIIDVSKLGFDEQDRIDLVCLLAKPEQDLGGKRINEWFRPHFFTTNFWYMWCSMFAFEPWHSAMEFKRYVFRFIHELPRIQTLAGVDRTSYNQFDSIVRPLLSWLKDQGVHVVTGAQVTDLDFASANEGHTVQKISLSHQGQAKEIAVSPDDLVFVTNGSMTASSSLGSMYAAAVLDTSRRDGAWSLWEKIAVKSPDFGHPQIFNGRIGESKWISFTVTCKNSLFFTLMEAFSGNEAGTGALVTLKDSNWLLSIVLAYQPHFIGQPHGVTVFWGYGLFPDKTGDYVHKKMSECSGTEILIELLSHLHFRDYLPAMLANSICIPCIMPYITSEFLTRTQGDRPAVVPPGSVNFAFLGQFTEIPEDVVFTVEYSVRSAQIAVYTLLGIDKKIPPLYKGQHDIQVVYQAVKAMHH